MGENVIRIRTSETEKSSACRIDGPYHTSIVKNFDELEMLKDLLSITPNYFPKPILFDYTEASLLSDNGKSMIEDIQKSHFKCCLKYEELWTRHIDMIAQRKR